MQILNFCQHTFLDDLSNDSNVIDLGVNRGEFVELISERYGCKVFGVEANPELHKKLLEIPNFSSINAAAAGKSGVVKFRKIPEHDGSIIFDFQDDGEQFWEVPSFSMKDILSKSSFDVVDLIKVDIEGAELELFQNCDLNELTDVKQMTVEFHDFIDSTSLPVINELINELREQFHTIKMSYRDYSNVLFLNKKYYSYRFWTKVRFVKTKYKDGFKRVLKRVI
ncbi:MAG: FkbM family methyltransferase [Bacteroidota bacterium]